MISDEKQIAKVIGQTIAKYRKVKGLSQEKMAELMGLSNDAISRMERGTITLSVVRLYQFAEVLDCRAADLLTESGIDDKDQVHQLDNLLNQLSSPARKHFIEIAEKMVAWKKA